MVMFLFWLVAAVMLLAIIVDWRQTRRIAKNPEKWHELNPMLDRNPSLRSVNTYFGLVLLLFLCFCLFIAPHLNELVNLGAISLATVIQVLVILHNHKLGIKG